MQGESGRNGAVGQGLSLSLLGPFRVQAESGDLLHVGSKKNRALLAILALAPGMSVSRERLAGLLWGDHGEEQARASLRQSLAMLRKELGPGAAAGIVSGDNGVSLQPQCIQCDALEVLAAARSEDVAFMRRAGARWIGTLLQDLSLQSEGYEDWLSAERGRLNGAAIQLFERLSQRLTGEERVSAATGLVAIDPLRESSHRLLMRAYAETGDKGLAMRQFETCRELLKAELQVEPAEETLALRREIAAGRDDATTLLQPRAEVLTENSVEASRPAIAVLPLENADPSSDQVFLSDGISDDIIAALSRFHRFTVISRASSFTYRGRSVAAATIGQELGVQFVLRGVLRKAGSRIRVTAELVDTGSGAVVWSDRLEHPDDDVFEVIDDLSQAIALTVVGRIEDEVLRQARRKSTSLFGAYRLMLQGRALLQRPDWNSKLEARALFEEALLIDPDFAQAHVQLALSYLQQFFFDDSGQALERANAIAADALLLDEEEPWCHMVLGLSHLHRRRFDLAVRHCERAVALNPYDPGLTARLGLVLTDVGRPAEAVAAIEKAKALNPLNPDKYNDYLALALYGAHRYGAALSALQSLPDNVFYTHVWSAAVQVRLGDAGAARIHAGRALELAPEFSVSRFAKMEPIKDAADLAHWTEALSLAGFPT